MPLRPNRVRLVPFLALLPVAAVPHVAAAEAPLSQPVLWEGAVHEAGGQPAVAEVVAYARPSGADLAPGNDLVEIARTRTDEHGNYTLTADPAGALRGVEDGSGWANVMVAAFGRDGSVSMAVDSVVWQPAARRGQVRAAGTSGDRGDGRWITSPAQRELPAPTVRAASADAMDSGVDLAAERPAVMVLSGQGQPVVSAQGASVGPRIPMCAGPHEAKPMGVHRVGIGEIHLNRDWTGKFEYRTTRSTSFQVGLKQEGKKWSVAGSTSSVKGESHGTGNEFLPAGKLYRYQAELMFERFSWRCEIAGKWQWVYTLEPTEWNGGLPRSDGGTPPRCNPTYKSTIPPTGHHYRDKGSGTTVQGGIQVAGFSGSTSTTTTEGVYQYWKSQRDEERYLCGSSDWITKNTRVFSPA